MMYKIHDNKSIRFKLRQLGLALIITGAALGMYLNFFLGDYGWNSYIMFASIVLLPNYNNLLNFRLPSYCIDLGGILYFQILCIFYLYSSVVPDELSKTQLYTFHLFTIGCIISLMSLKTSDLNFSLIVGYSWILTSVCTILCFICYVSGIYSIEYAKVHSGQGYMSILSELTMTAACTTNIICGLFLNPSKKTLAILRNILFILSIISLFLLEKRTPIIISALIIAAYIWRISNISLRIKVKYLNYTFIIIIGLLLLLSNPDVINHVATIFDNIINGISDMLNGTSKSGASATMRYESREWAFDYIENFNFFEFLFGAGYMTRWLDIPILQSFLDMGIIGFIIYAWFTFIYPILIFLSKKSTNKFVLFACFLNFYTVFSAFNSGHPYSHVKWWPVILLIIIVMHQKKYNDNRLKNSKISLLQS